MLSLSFGSNHVDTEHTKTCQRGQGIQTQSHKRASRATKLNQQIFFILTEILHGLFLKVVWDASSSQDLNSLSNHPRRSHCVKKWKKTWNKQYTSIPFEHHSGRKAAAAEENFQGRDSRLAKVDAWQSWTSELHPDRLKTHQPNMKVLSSSFSHSASNIHLQIKCAKNVARQIFRKMWHDVP